MTMEKWRHKKRGSLYTVLGQARLETNVPMVEGAALTVYQGEDGMLWARPVNEFQDGRFEQIPAGKVGANATAIQVARALRCQAQCIPEDLERHKRRKQKGEAQQPHPWGDLLEGEIKVGQVLAWEPLIPSAAELVYVTRIVGQTRRAFEARLSDKPLKLGGLLRESERIGPVPQFDDDPMIVTRTIDSINLSGCDEFVNDESRMREACVRTMLKDFPVDV